MSDINYIFFELIQVSLGNRDSVSKVLNDSEWNDLYYLAGKHSLLGLCFEGVCHLGDNSDNIYESVGMDEATFYNWMGAAVMTQTRNERHLSIIGKLAEIYEGNGLGMMLLKGYGLSLLYPIPSMRAAGDIDIYLFPLSESTQPAWERGDLAVANNLGVTISHDSEHHTKFEIDGIFVENHYDFINTRIRRSSISLEKELKSLASSHDNWTEIEGHKVYFPSEKLNLLFLLRHSAGHFACEGITLRTVLDWGLFVTSSKSIDWNWLWGIAEKYNFHNFLGCLNSICIENLGFAPGKFQQKSYDMSLKPRVLNEILTGPELIVDHNVYQRLRRWWEHRWKHKICYSDSLISSFISSVIANFSSASID